jgi:5'-nucleotidase
VRILVTNDDGIDAAGLPPLVEALAAAGHEIVVAAPAQNASGASAAIGSINPQRRIAAGRREGFAAALAAYAVDGPPGVAALSGILGAYGDPPDLVVSGINAGANTGNAVLHSGTIGAVLTARNFGVSGLAISLDEGEAWPWQTAARLAVETLPSVPLAPAVAVSLNSPSLPYAEVRGLRWATLARSGTVRAVAAGTRDGTLEFTFAQPDATERPGTDVALLAEGFATITVLTGIGALVGEDGVVDADSIRQLAEAQGPGRPELRPVQPSAQRPQR